MSRALLLNWFDLAAGAATAFDAWHNREHLIERMSVPGFLVGRRYVRATGARDPGHDYLVVYDARDLSVFESAPYGERLDNPTPLTQSVVPLLRDLTRTVCDVRAEMGRGIGAYLRTIRMPTLSQQLSQEPSILDDALRAAYACDGVVKTQLGKPDVGVTHFKDKTQEGRATQTHVRPAYPWVAVVEAMSLEAVDAATDAFANSLRHRFHQLPAQWTCHSYRLEMTMTAEQGA